MGNICCTQKDEWLTEQIQRHDQPQSRPIARLVIEQSDEEESGGEDLPFEKILSRRESPYSSEQEDDSSKYASPVHTPRKEASVSDATDCQPYKVEPLTSTEEVKHQRQLTCETEQDEEEQDVVDTTVLLPQPSPISIEEVLPSQLKKTVSLQPAHQSSLENPKVRKPPTPKTTLSQSQRLFSRSAIKPSAQASGIVEGEEEDLCLSSQSSSEEMSEFGGSMSATSSQPGKKRIEMNFNDLARSQKRRTSSIQTANNYVWIKERRTTFTGLTFQQRERGMKGRSMTMVEKKPPQP